MERLTFDTQLDYQATEASYHIARYALVRGFCAGRRVLDVACGEGYGSFLMGTKWGASAVVGVDISQEAIESARENFFAPNILYEVGSAYDLEKHIKAEKYDLIVSLETIEHLDNPTLFLNEIKKVASKDANIIISCPNDPMLYEGDSAGNPFHLHRYTSEEFFAMVESILGPCTHKLIGTPIAGTGNFLVDSDTLRVGENQASMLSGKLRYDSPVAQVPPDENIDLKRATYYMGIWGPTTPEIAPELIAFYPADIKSSAQERLRQDVTMLSAQVTVLKTRIWELEQQTAIDETLTRLQSPPVIENPKAIADMARWKSSIDNTERRELDRQLRHQGLRNEALSSENALMREAIRDLKSKNADITLQLSKVREIQATLEYQLRMRIPDRLFRIFKRGLGRL